MPRRIELHPKRFATVTGKRMAYVELGEGDYEGEPLANRQRVGCAPV